MPIFNIYDQRRASEHNPSEVDVVFEVFADDWSLHGLPRDFEDFTEWMQKISVYDAVMYSMKLQGKVSMFLYDPGWIIANFGFIVAVHPRIKRDVMVPHEMDERVLRVF